MKKFAMIILVIVSLCSCHTRLMDCTIVSSKNVDVSRLVEFKRSNVRVEGKDTKYIIIIFPTGIPNLKDALDQAIESTPGTVALVDAVLYRDNFYFPYVFGYTSFSVEGTPLIDPKLPKK